MNLFKRKTGLAAAGLLLWAAGIAHAGPEGPLRFHSPSARFDLVLESLPKDWTHAQKARPGAAKASRDQYAIFLYVTGSSEPVNVIYYTDEDPPVTPETRPSRISCSTVVSVAASSCANISPTNGMTIVNCSAVSGYQLTKRGIHRRQIIFPTPLAPARIKLRIPPLHFLFKINAHARHDLQVLHHRTRDPIGDALTLRGQRF